MFRRIAVPRLPGSAAVGVVERLLAAGLRELGYTVQVTEFRATPARLAGASVAGAGLGWIALMLAPLLVVPLPGWPVTLIGVAGLGFVCLLIWITLEGRLPIAGPAVEARNIEARRGTPRLWLVAHVDSKAQRISLRGRIVATLLAAAAAGGLALSLLLRPFFALPWWVVAPVVVAAVVGGGGLSLGVPRDASPGAVDNATGLVALLTAARRLAERDDIGVLVTGAEEFGMEGAREWVSRGPPDGWFVNFDGLDDRGRYRVVVHGPGDRAQSSAALAAAVLEAMAARGHRAVRASSPPGVFVDGAVLARHGFAGITLMRGDWRTLGVVHTVRDAPERVDIRWAAEAGEVVARAAASLLG